MKTFPLSSSLRKNQSLFHPLPQPLFFEETEVSPFFSDIAQQMCSCSRLSKFTLFSSIVKSSFRSSYHIPLRKMNERDTIYTGYTIPWCKNLPYRLLYLPAQNTCSGQYMLPFRLAAEIGTLWPGTFPLPFSRPAPDKNGCRYR